MSIPLHPLHPESTSTPTSTPRTPRTPLVRKCHWHLKHACTDIGVFRIRCENKDMITENSCCSHCLPDAVKQIISRSSDIFDLSITKEGDS